jgi:hypothetical protein
MKIYIFSELFKVVLLHLFIDHVFDVVLDAHDFELLLNAVNDSVVVQVVIIAVAIFPLCFFHLRWVVIIVIVPQS